MPERQQDHRRVALPIPIGLGRFNDIFRRAAASIGVTAVEGAFCFQGYTDANNAICAELFYALRRPTNIRAGVNLSKDLQRNGPLWRCVIRLRANA